MVKAPLTSIPAQEDQVQEEAMAKTVRLTSTQSLLIDMNKVLGEVKIKVPMINTDEVL